MNYVLTSLVWAALLWTGFAVAQPATTETVNTPVTNTHNSTASVMQPSAAVVGNIQGANIFAIQPDASNEPGYAEQSAAERAKVQPGNNAPMWRQVGAGATGYSSLPKSQAPEAGNLIQPFVQYPGSRLTNAGEAWRQVRNRWILPYGGALIVITLLAVALFYKAKGAIEISQPLTGKLVERFTFFERAAHQINAVAFSLLAISGIVIAFGKFFLLPILGASLFGWLTYLLKYVHNFTGPAFVVSLIVVFFTFVRDNFFHRIDLAWFRVAGGLFDGTHVPSGRFNGGEKILFWMGTFALGLTISISGLALDHLIPGMSYVRGTMQISHMVHAVSAVMMICLFIGHIYLATIGMRGAYDGMGTGYVDAAWARDHHSLWLEDVESGKLKANIKTV